MPASIPGSFSRARQRKEDGPQPLVRKDSYWLSKEMSHRSFRITGNLADSGLTTMSEACRHTSLLLFAAPNLPAIHFADGNSAAAFTLDGKTGPHDAHCCWEHGSRIFAQVSRQQGILAQHPNGTRPRRRRFLQNLLPRLPIHFSLSR